MLLVPVRLAQSPIHGLGVFALAPIAEGKEIWRFSDGLDLDLDPAVLESLTPDMREVLLHYGYIDRRLGRFILCCDNARFINHSDEANTRSDCSMDPHGVDVAVREIAAGEEITIDYTQFEPKMSAI